MTIKPFYTTGEVARMLGVSPATIFRAVEKGQLKASATPGGHNRVARKDLEEFAKSLGVDAKALTPGKTRVLVVEDNLAELRVMQRGLQKEPGFEVQTTASGYGAGYLTKAFRPDVILLDIFLSDLDGREVVKIIRADPELKDTIVLAVTAASDAKDLKEIEAAGVDEIIRKPIPSAELRAKILKLLE
ncbi:MAG: response regulator [Elusimicrobiota bacterium]|jgi:excisionase family DNA binding protein